METPTHMSVGSLTLRDMVFKHTYTKTCGLFGLSPLRWSDCDYIAVWQSRKQNTACALGLSAVVMAAGLCVHRQWDLHPSLWRSKLFRSWCLQFCAIPLMWNWINKQYVGLHCTLKIWKRFNTVIFLWHFLFPSTHHWLYHLLVLHLNTLPLIDN